jgi:hypothetical protein
VLDCAIYIYIYIYILLINEHNVYVSFENCVLSGFRLVGVIIVTVIINNWNIVLDDVIVTRFRDLFVLRIQSKVKTRTGTYLEPVKSACAILVTASSVGHPFWAHIL